MPLFVENQKKSTWTPPSRERDTAASPADESRYGGAAPDSREADVSSARALPYPEDSSGWQGSRSDVHGPPPPIPGVLAVDLVGYDGRQAVGDFGWTLTLTDRTTGWIELGPVHTNAEVHVVAALESYLHGYLGRGSHLSAVGHRHPAVTAPWEDKSGCLLGAVTRQTISL
jgi:hypothetical protein